MDRNTVLEEAAQFTEFYAQERMRQCEDTILLDPALAGGRSRSDFARSKDLMVEGCIHSAGYHAAMHIAESLRAMKTADQAPPKGDTP